MAESRSVRLRLAIPWLPGLFPGDPEDTRLPRSPAGEWLLARADRVGGPVSSWREWLLDGAGLPAGLLERLPAGPCTAVAQVSSRPRGTWACARPVHLLTAIDHLQLGAEALVLDDAERATLARDLNGHFADRGFVFHAARAIPDSLLECSSPVECSTSEPSGLIGCNLRDLMPTGRDAAAIRSLTNEIQMLLHEHPVNVARASRGLPVINSLWLWGFGELGEPIQLDLPLLFTDDAWLAGLWQLHGRSARGLSDLPAESWPPVGPALVAWSRCAPGSPTEALATAERQCFVPLSSALRAGRVNRIEMLLGSCAFVVDRKARWRFWRRGRSLQSVFE